MSVETHWHRGRSVACALGIFAVFLCAPVMSPTVVSGSGEAIRMSWIRQFGTATIDVAIGVAVDASGAYAAGYTHGALESGTAGLIDAFVRKYDAAGAALWTRQFGTASNDIAKGISVDASGIYVAGHVGGTLPPDQTIAGVGDAEAYVRKYNPAGTVVWVSEFGTSAVDAATAVAAEASGVYVAGYTFGGLSDPSAGFADAFVRKYDGESGTVLWTRQFGTIFNDYANAVAADASGVYVAGTLTSVETGVDAFVRKYDPSGSTVLWSHVFGSLNSDIANALSVDASGVYVAGNTFGELPDQTSAGLSDAFVRKYDFAGNEAWTHQFGTPSADSALGVSARGSGAVIVGYTGGSLSGQPFAGGLDAFLRKYDATGAEVWTELVGTELNDLAGGVWDAASGVYVVGQTDGEFAGQTSEGLTDAVVAKFAGVRLAFSTNRDLNLEVYSMNGDGTGPTRLTNNPKSDVEPVWSPDGARLAFASNRNGNYDVYVMNADGTSPTRLTTSSARDVNPAWSPDGTKIAFASNRNNNFDIYVMNADGTGQTRLTTHSAVDVEPTWSPDGGKIAFTSTRTGESDIYKMNADGTSPIRLTTSSAIDVNPAWSPDGTRIAFASNRNGNLEIHVMNADGTGPTRITTHPALDMEPAWSPDGAMIAFTTRRDGNLEIYTMNADGTGLTRLTNNPASDTSPSWG